MVSRRDYHVPYSCINYKNYNITKQQRGFISIYCVFTDCTRVCFIFRHFNVYILIKINDIFLRE